ncbi:hypothetical protein PFLUV_G00090600 [Perca fluviatilis]|uniref:Uncharacterized protein n=1 Tax=Perca fluviatilis TaxID=8168 RepID=A0A6A5FCG9_PERFL|nr:hypothetical protein PFLUV_G00090600 [Perca fluviatilis]
MRRTDCAGEAQFISNEPNYSCAHKRQNLKTLDVDVKSPPGVLSAMKPEEEDEGVPPSSTALSEEHDSQIQPESYRAKQERADSPAPTCVSMKSDTSMGFPMNFRMEDPISKAEQERADSPAPTCVSMKSDTSMGFPMNFRLQDPISK